MSFTALGRNPVKGTLFIIGGGDRSPELIGEMVRTAPLGKGDYIVVLPMATSVPAESVAAIQGQLSAQVQNPVVSFNFTRQEADERHAWIDSVRRAKLIYITGGDQNKFMGVVKGTALYDALHFAYRNGATIAGTSAGAAIMSEVMITGSRNDVADGSFTEVKRSYAQTSEGMGFLKSAIIDQHFIMRSRYNRLLSVLSDHPTKILIGIDEGTALVVRGRNARIVGDSQVLVISHPRKLQFTPSGKSAFTNSKLSLYVDGQRFKFKN